MRCPACESANEAEAVECIECGSRLPRKPRRGGIDAEEMDDEAYRQSPFFIGANEYANVKALRAYLFGLLGLIPVLGVILGLIAIVLGVSGLKYAKSHPKARGNAQAKTGILLGSLGFAFNAAGIALMTIGLQS